MPRKMSQKRSAERAAVVRQLEESLPNIGHAADSALVVPTSLEISRHLGMPADRFHLWGNPKHPGGAIGELIYRATGLAYVGKGHVFGIPTDQQPSAPSAESATPPLHEQIASMSFTELTVASRLIHAEIQSRVHGPQDEQTA